MAESTFDTTSSPSYPNSGTTTPPPDKDLGPVTYNGTINLSAQTLSLYSGESTDVSINVDSDGAKVKEIKVTVEFDSSIVEAQDGESLTAGDQITVDATSFTVETNEIDNDLGQATLVLTTDTPVTVNDSIASVNFKALQTGDASITVSQISSSVTDEDSNDILSSTQGQTITITAQNTVPVTPPPTTPPEDELPQSGISGASGVTMISALLLISVSVITFIRRKKNAA
ncbi:LPXTG cell wall anchor domain-containing protein [Candidatus Dojkabacteria bacterium]|uniref:LPXTG cell wall anchor domain-containing protein n=1 Tax=Candidatus Dojkabacteria bacterium TaxID=2099670 RepID=A0A955L3F1_9BACT|nr:LPXTG cell wall anchor domain-containing protein [Candidatus Dojkabacteria bacterium]